ncbi:uncharacterized protein LOC134252294, partial [Saccostrea cucullata]
MLTVAKLRESKGNKPYSQPLKVKVCGVGTIQRYQTDNGEKKECATVGLADSTDAMKGTVYDTTKLKSLNADNTVILMNYIYKNENEPTVIITKNTKVMKTGAMEVPHATMEKGARIANPPPAMTRPIKDIKTLPVKSLVSVKGRIVSEDMTKTVKVKGVDVCVKSVSLKDDTDSIKVSLWRDLSDSSIVGKYLSITNVVVTNFNEEISVSTTSKSVLEECEPPVVKVQGSVIGFHKAELHISLLMNVKDDYLTYDVPLEMMSKALDCTLENLESEIEKKLPLQCSF